jgi:hypothetical protein
VDALERTAAHEGGHCAMLVTLGVPVLAVDVIPTTERRGVVMADLTIDDAESAIGLMMVVLAGPLMADDLEDLPKWPLRDDRSDDERVLCAYAKALDFTRDDYDDLVTRTIRCTLTPQFMQLHAAITGMLDYRPRLGPDALAHIEGIVCGDA